MAGYRRPESILVVVYTARSTLLLRRVRPFAFWQSVTGSLEPGERPADAAVRELLEETGIDGAGRIVRTGVERSFTIDPRWRDRYAPGVTRNTEHEFRLALDEPEPVTLNAAEHSAFRWVPVPDAVGLVWSSTNKAALESLPVPS